MNSANNHITLKEIENSDFKIDPEYATALDGGTIEFVLVIGSDEYHMSLDERLDSDTPGEFYLGGYPGSNGSVYLGKSEKLKQALDELTHKDLKKDRDDQEIKER